MKNQQQRQHNNNPPLEKGGRGDLKIFVYKQTSQNPPPETGTPFFKGGSTPRGNALVLAIFIVMVTAAIAYALITTSSFAVRRTAQLNSMDMCWQAAQASEIFAETLLKKPKGQEELPTSLQEDWALPFELQLASNVSLTGQITDLQGQFNINSLIGSQEGGIYSPALIFNRLLTLLNIPDAQHLAQNVSEWVNEGKPQSDQTYLQLTPTYRASHLPMSSITELNLIVGFSEPIFTQIEPYISALPAGLINVNTAPAHVLAALLDTPLHNAEALVHDRANYAFKDKAEFINRAKAKGVMITEEGALQDMYEVSTSYFLLKTTATCQKTTFISYSFIKRLPQAQLTVYQRTSQL